MADGLFKGIGSAFNRYIGGLLGEDVESMTPEQRRAARLNALGIIGRGMISPELGTQALASVRANREAQRQMREAQAILPQITGRLFGDDLSARISQAQGQKGQIMPRPGLEGVVGRDAQGNPIVSPAYTQKLAEEKELSEVTPMSRYVRDPQEALRLAMTPAGTGAMALSPVLAKYVENMMSQKEGAQLTDDAREYQIAVAQGYDGSFLDYLKDVKGASAPRVSIPVNLGQTADVEAQKTIAARESESLADLNKSAMSAKRSWNAANTLINLSSKPGVISGSLAPGIIGANSFLVSLFGKGVTNEDMTDAATFNAAASRLFIEQMGALGGARGLSAEESMIVFQSLPQLATSPQARIAIARLVQSKAEETIDDYNQAYNNYRDAFKDIKTGFKPIEIPRRDQPPADSVPVAPLR